MPSNGTRTGLYTGLASGALAVGALTYVGLVDPHRPGALFPACPFKLLTGWNCPACGGLRMTHDLLHGDVSAAVVDNVFLLIGLPLLAIWAVWRATQAVPRRGMAALVGLALIDALTEATALTVNVAVRVTGPP
jgi:hypothetical protein